MRFYAFVFLSSINKNGKCGYFLSPDKIRIAITIDSYMAYFNKPKETNRQNDNRELIITRRTILEHRNETKYTMVFEAIFGYFHRNLYYI